MMITVSEYARRHGKNHSCVHKLRKEGRLPGVVRTGTVYLIDEDTPYPEDLRKGNAINFSCVKEKKGGEHVNRPKSPKPSPNTALRDARENAGLTQAEVADIVCINPLSYIRYEKGVRIPSVDIAIRICRALRTGEQNPSVEDLFS